MVHIDRTNCRNLMNKRRVGSNRFPSFCRLTVHQYMHTSIPTCQTYFNGHAGALMRVLPSKYTQGRSHEVYILIQVYKSADWCTLEWRRSQLLTWKSSDYLPLHEVGQAFEKQATAQCSPGVWAPSMAAMWPGFSQQKALPMHTMAGSMWWKRASSSAPSWRTAYSWRTRSTKGFCFLLQMRFRFTLPGILKNVVSVYINGCFCIEDLYLLCQAWGGGDLRGWHWWMGKIKLNRRGKKKSRLKLLHF